MAEQRVFWKDARKIIQICPYPETRGVVQGVLALCDDGSLWMASIIFETNGNIDTQWIELSTMIGSSHYDPKSH